MLGLFTLVGLAGGHVILTLNALAGSIRHAFTLGTAGAALRAALTLLSTALLLRLSYFPGKDSSPSPVAALVLLLACIAGPLVTFVTLFFAHRRSRDVPAAQEEQADRLFNAWLTLGILDGIFVVIMLGAMALSRSS